jgi:ribosomal protein S27AE
MMAWFPQPRSIGRSLRFTFMPRGNTEPAQSLDTLLHDLRDGDDIAARGAAEALGKLGFSARVAVPDLIDALTTRVHFGMPQVEFQATVALGQVGDPRAVTPLIRVLGSSAPATRREAIRSLASIGGPEAMRAVRVMLWDEDRHVRGAAAKILGTTPTDASQVKVRREAALTVIDAQWRGKPRNCPNCGETFVAQQSRCKCPKCLTAFYASHLTNPHEYPFDSPPEGGADD